MTHEELLRAFESVYDAREGRTKYMTVLPGVLADFRAMLEKASSRPLREEYRLDDGRGILILTGSKDASGYRIDICFSIPENAY